MATASNSNEIKQATIKPYNIHSNIAAAATAINGFMKNPKAATKSHRIII